MTDIASAVIVGGASGIGRACTDRLLAAGSSVVVCDRVEPKALGKNSLYLPLDVTASSAMIRSVVASVPKPDALIYSAGMQIADSLMHVHDAAVARMFDINVLGAMRVLGAYAAAWQAAKHRARVVLVASVAGLANGGPGLSAYAASKAALIQYARCAARELAPNVCVNVVCPGWTHTSFNRPVMEYMGQAAFGRAIAAVPLGFAAHPDEIARVILFLASEASNYMTGSVVVVDGGLSLQ